MKKQKFAKIFVGGLLFISLLTSASAMSTLIKKSEYTVDGKHMIEEVYETDTAVKSESLIKSDFKRSGYLYSISSLVKDVFPNNSDKEVRQDYKISVNDSDENSARIKAVKDMPPYIEYNQDGYKGKLYPILDSLVCEKINCPNYTGYDITINYCGNVEFESKNLIQYTVTYTGAESSEDSNIDNLADSDEKIFIAIICAVPGAMLLMTIIAVVCVLKPKKHN